MPLKLNVGLSRKRGLPNYGSIGASCQLEVELDAGLLAQDPNQLQQRVRESFEVCRQAVQAELNQGRAGRPLQAPRTSGDEAVRQRSPRSRLLDPVHPAGAARQAATPPTSTGDRPAAATNGHAADDAAASPVAAGASAPPPDQRPATAAQRHAIETICARAGVDLTEQLQRRLGIASADELTLRQASRLISQLRLQPAEPPF